MSSKNNVLICLFIFHLLAAGSVTGSKIGIYEIEKGDFSVKVISVLLPDKHVCMLITLTSLVSFTTRECAMVEWLTCLTPN